MIAFEEALGPKRFFIWSKENQLWRSFFRTIVAGHWKKEDATEFMTMKCYYEIAFDHSKENIAQNFVLEVLERSSHFMAAKVSKLALNNVKCLILLGKDAKMADKIKHLAKLFEFEFVRVRGKDEVSSHEKTSREKFSEYLENLQRAFAPMGGLLPPNAS